jgi:hypothetical protein
MKIAFSGESSMTTRNFCLLAAVIFGIIAILQLVRALSGWPLTVGDITVPIWPSWIAAIVMAGLAWLGYQASRR